MEPRFYDKEPEIVWKKVLCPICGEPTGPASKCYDKVPPNLPEHKRKIINKSMGIVPIYSKNCGFRQDNFWEATINYPVSLVLLNRLEKIDGVERIFATKPHTFQCAFGKLFDEKVAKRSINIAYRSMIKEFHAKELGSFEYPVANVEYNGIILPNGKKFVNMEKVENDAISQSLIIADLLQNLPKSSGILVKEFEKPKPS